MIGRKINFLGLPVVVVTDAEAEDAGYVVCMPEGTPSPFDDNLTAFCCKCGIKVFHRWHAPKKPPKICFECFVKLEKDEERRPNG